MSLRVVPITVKDATRAVRRWHSHHDAPRGGLFAVSVMDGDDLACVAIVGRPVAQRLGNTSRGIAEVTRVASGGTEHAASMCLAAATRMALAGGYRRVVSYTLLGEAGTSYRAAGWRVTGLVEASQAWHSRPGRTTMQGGGQRSDGRRGRMRSPPMVRPRSWRGSASGGSRSQRGARRCRC